MSLERSDINGSQDEACSFYIMDYYTVICYSSRKKGLVPLFPKFMYLHTHIYNVCLYMCTCCMYTSIYSSYRSSGHRGQVLTSLMGNKGHGHLCTFIGWHNDSMDFTIPVLPLTSKHSGVTPVQHTGARASLAVPNLSPGDSSHGKDLNNLGSLQS